MKRCLIVDDSRVVRKVARRIVEDLHFSTEEAADGSEALEACRRAMPDAVLLDWNMPVMDGWQFLDEFVQIPANKKICIYMVTSSIDPDDINKAKTYDSLKNYIVKPITTQVLQNILSDLAA